MAPKTKGKILGIDLGTTNSCMAVIADGEIVVLRNREGARTTPSVIAFLKGGGERLVGLAARRQASTNPRDTVFSMKRFMGMKFEDASVQMDQARMPFAVVPVANGDAWVKAGGQSWSPAELSAMVLEKLKHDAEQALGEEIKQAVITVPAYFSDAQRQATKDAGKIAGLEVLRILNEPTAAALSCGLDQRRALTVAVYDLGGGTFDVTLLQLKGGVFEVRSTNGDTHLGGDDFDQAIVELLLKSFEEQNGLDLSKDKMALQRLKEAAEAAKIELSDQVQAEINLPFIAKNAQGPLHLTYSLTREGLELATRELVNRTMRPIEKALGDAKIPKTQVDEILLVGGMTRMPAVRNAVELFFGKAPHPGVDPDEAVAVGAAIQGGILQGQVRDKLLLDVTPLSLGVRVAGGLFSKLIDRNTTVPTRKTTIYTTANDLQASVRISVFQGENPLAEDNTFLGDFQLVDIKPEPRGVPQIEVSFDIDANGILRVRAQDKETRRSQSIRIEPNSGLKDEQLNAMIEAAKAHASSHQHHSESEQYILTCRKLIEECRRELDQPGFGEGMDKRAALEWLTQLGKHLEAASIVDAKAALVELNQFILRLRMADTVSS